MARNGLCGGLCGAPFAGGPFWGGRFGGAGQAGAGPSTQRGGRARRPDAGGRSIRTHPAGFVLNARLKSYLTLMT